MKLEMKHIAPYSTYELRAEVFASCGEIIEITGLDIDRKHTIDKDCYWINFEGSLCVDGMCVMKNGIWATIVRDEKINELIEKYGKEELIKIINNDNK